MANPTAPQQIAEDRHHHGQHRHGVAEVGEQHHQATPQGRAQALTQLQGGAVGTDLGHPEQGGPPDQPQDEGGQNQEEGEPGEGARVRAIPVRQGVGNPAHGPVQVRPA